MRLMSLLVASVLFSLIDVSNAFPLNSQVSSKQPAVRRRVAYSVVAVDGGGSAATSPTPPAPDTITLIQTASDIIATVTVSPNSTPRSIETVVATKIVSVSEPTKTVDTIVPQDVSSNPSSTSTLSYMIVNPAETSTLSSTTLPTSQTSTSIMNLKYASSPSTSTSTLFSAFTWTSTPTLSKPMTKSNPDSERTHPSEAKHSKSTIVSAPSTPTSKICDDRTWRAIYPMWNATSTVPSRASATVFGVGRAQNIWKKG
ncbi:hypothetical protein BDR22DRAFT_873011 [Usnea florida]